MRDVPLSSQRRARAPARAGGLPATVAILVVLGASLGLLALTPVLPFVDFYAHIARYHILAHIDGDPRLEASYDAAWTLLPNLGMDILGTWMMRIWPPLTTAKLIAAATMVAPFLGIVALARALHGRVGLATVFLAGILIFNHILIWGFANFLLGLGLALCGLAMWIALAGRPWLRWAIMVPFAVLLFFVHGLTFAIWGLLLGTLELMLAHEARDLRPLRLLRRMAVLASLAVLPALLFAQMPTSGAEGGVTAAFDNLRAHAAAGSMWTEIRDEILQRVDTFLRVADSGFPVLDRVLGLGLWAGVVFGLVSGALQLDRRLWLAVGAAGLMVLVMPPNMFSVGYLDDRAPLVLMALLAAGIAPVNDGLLVRAFGGLLAVRLALVGLFWSGASQSYESFLDTLARHPDTGAVAMPAYFDGTADRDPTHVTCKPLSFLLLLQNGTAVPTFAFGTQQPLRLDGLLARDPGTRLLPRAARTDPETGRVRAEDREKVLRDARAAGFDAIVTCDGGPVPPAPAGLRQVAHRAPWTLYVASAPGRAAID